MLLNNGEQLRNLNTEDINDLWDNELSENTTFNVYEDTDNDLILIEIKQNDNTIILPWEVLTALHMDILKIILPEDIINDVFDGGEQLGNKIIEKYSEE